MGSFDEKLTKEADKYMEDYKNEMGADYKALRAQFESGQDAGTQHAMSEMRNMMKENLRQQQQAAAITGASEANMAAARRAAGDAIGKASAQMAADSTNKAMAAMAGYQDVAKNYAETQSSHRYDQAKTQAQLGAQLASAGINAVGQMAGSAMNAWGGK